MEKMTPQTLCHSIWKGKLLMLQIPLLECFTNFSLLFWHFSQGYAFSYQAFHEMLIVFWDTFFKQRRTIFGLLRNVNRENTCELENCKGSWIWKMQQKKMKQHLQYLDDKYFQGSLKSYLFHIVIYQCRYAKTDGQKIC